MKNLFELNTRGPEDAKLHFVVDVGLASSVMMRNFEKGSNRRLKEKLIKELPRVFAVQSAEDYRIIHSDICDWGTENIRQTKKIGGGGASYGQIAKVLDVAMKVIVYDCRYPEYDKSEMISKWLHAAVDNKMMACLKATYPGAIEPWPTTLKEVDESTYGLIQKAVREFISRDIDGKYRGKIIPAQFDDMYWEALNREL